MALQNQVNNVGGGGSGAVDSVNGQTGDVNLTTNNIPDSTNKKYVTDAEKTKLANLSGVNTGDQNMFSSIAVDGQPTVTPDSTTSQLEIEGGSNVTVTTDNVLKKIRISATGGGGGGAVDSVNGQTGDVDLDSDDIPEGSTNLYFNDERAQDAVGAMVDSTLVYTDGGPTLGRAAISGDITIASGSNSAAIGAGVIVNADINASAAIDATKIADGSVTNAEFQYLGSVTSDIQTQLNGKVTGPASATDNAIARFDGTTGKLVQNSDVSIDDGGNLTTAGNILTPGYVRADLLQLRDGVDQSHFMEVVLASNLTTDRQLAIVTGDFDRTLTFPGNFTGSGTSSGTNTGDQTITLTSDVTGTGTGSFATTIANNAVTNAKLDDMAANTVKARQANTTGDPSDVALSTNTLLGRGAGNIVPITLDSNTLIITGSQLSVLPQSASSMVRQITQIGHGFVVGDVIRHSSSAGSYVKAQADSLANSAAIGYVASVANANTFTITLYGYVSAGVPVATAGTVLYLDPTTAGALTSTEPTAIGQVSKPVAVVSQSGTAMYFLPQRSVVITASTVVSVNQTAHGFAVGDVIRETSTANTYTKAQADTAANAEVVGIVSTVVNSNSFVYTTQGIFTSGVPAATAGTVFFLSPTTAGLLTSTAPSTVGQISKPLVTVLQSGTSGLFNNQRGITVSSASGFSVWSIPNSTAITSPTWTDQQDYLLANSTTTFTAYRGSPQPEFGRYFNTVLEQNAVSGIWGTATALRGMLVLSGNAYVFMADSGGNHRLYRAPIATTISNPANWTQITLSGTNLTNTATKYLVGYANGGFWVTDATNSVYVFSTLSGTTLTQSSTVSVSGANYSERSSVNSQGILISTAGMPYYRLADFTGSLIAQKTLEGFNNVVPFTVQDRFFIRDATTNTAFRFDLNV